MDIRPHVIRAVFKRNFVSYFSGVIGYLFIVLFVGAGAIWAFNPEFFANNLATMDQLNRKFPWLLLFIVPAITMTSWAEEKKQGTDELLFTLPGTDLEILLGKYFAVLAIYSAAILYSLLFCGFGVLTYLTYGNFDKGLLISNYVGYWLAGGALLAAGMLASVLTSSATVAFVAGTVLCAIPILISYIIPSGNLQMLSLSEQLRDFGLGMIPFGGLLYFVSLAVFFLYLNLVMISRRHWSDGPRGKTMGFHFLVRVLSLATILCCLNFAAASANRRLDLTAERLYTVYPTTRTTIQKIDPKRPVLIQAFISPTVPGEYVATRTNLIGLLRQFDQIGGDRVRVRIVDTEQYSPAADEAKRFGIQPQMIQSQRGGKMFAESVFLGAIISSGADDEVVVPFFDIGTPVEYELTRSIRTVAEKKRLKVGVLTTDAKLFGGFDQATFSQSPEWRIVSELKKQYEVDQVSPDSPITGQFDVLVAAMPSSLTDPQLTNLVDYIKQGHPVLIFDDPVPVSSRGLSLAPRQQKPNPGGMFGGGAPPQPKADGGRATRLIDALGILWDNGMTVWDNHNPHKEIEELIRPELVFINKASGAKEPFGNGSEISSGLQEVMVLFSGTIREKEGNAKRTFTPLLRTSPDSGTTAWEELIEETPAFFGMGGPRIKEDPLRVSDGNEHILAAHIKEAAEGPEKPGLNVIFVADLDMISDMMFSIRDRQMYGLQLDNVPFVLNAVDILANDDSMVSLRKRRAEQHTLARVEQQTKQYVNDRNQARQKADADAKEELTVARKRFADSRKKIEEDEKLDPRTKRIMLEQLQEEENRRLEVREAEIENTKQQKIEQSKGESERRIRAVEGRVQLWAALLPPIPALLVGLFVLLSRVKAERSGIHPDRMRRN